VSKVEIKALFMLGALFLFIEGPGWIAKRMYPSGTPFGIELGFSLVVGFIFGEIFWLRNMAPYGKRARLIAKGQPLKWWLLQIPMILALAVPVGAGVFGCLLLSGRLEPSEELRKLWWIVIIIPAAVAYLPLAWTGWAYRKEDKQDLTSTGAAHAS